MPASTALAVLADALSSNGPLQLSLADRALIADALKELAVAQTIIARQSLLLSSFGSDHGSLETSLRNSIEAATTDALRASPADGFDFTAAERARAELVDRLDSAESARDLILLALSFIASLAA